MALAFVFPGQGSQAVGMGRELAQESRAARLVFEAVDEALAPDGGRPLSSIAWEGPADELTRTANAQPAIMAASIAALRAAEEAAGGSILQRARFVAGHSLGEYSALAAAGALDLGDCARLLRARGQAMQAAVPQGRGAMAAVIGLELAAIREVLDCLPEAGVAEIANDNAPGQATISGDAAAIAGAAERCRAAGAKRAVPLDVSAPFHCALMAPAASVMRDRLAETEIRTPVIPVVTNVTARPVDDPGRDPGASGPAGDRTRALARVHRLDGGAGRRQVRRTRRRKGAFRPCPPHRPRRRRQERGRAGRGSRAGGRSGGLMDGQRSGACST